MGKRRAAFPKSATTGDDEALIETLLSVCNSKPFRYQFFSTADLAMSQHYRELLSKAIRSRASLANEFLPIGMVLIDNMKVRPTIEYGNRGFTLGYQHDFPTLEAALNYGVMLLLDISKPYGAALSRCGRSTCDKFYLARRNPKGGPANRHYCSPEHRDEAHDLRENRTTRNHK